MRDKLDFVKIKNVCIKGRYEESAKINWMLRFLTLHLSSINDSFPVFMFIKTASFLLANLTLNT